MGKTIHYATSDADADVRLPSGLSPGNWANLVWLPTVSIHIFVVMIIPTIIFWEYLTNFPSELNVWMRIFKPNPHVKFGRQISRAFLPWATLFLRYVSLIFGISAVLFQWGTIWDGTACGILWPVFLSTSIIMSSATAATLGWRAAIISKSAMSSRIQYNILRSIVWFMLLCQVVGQIVGWKLTPRIAPTDAINGQCQANNDIDYGNAAGKTNYYMRSRLPLVGSLSVSLAYDFGITVITIVSLVKLMRNGSTRSKLARVLVDNTIRYFISILLCAAFALVWYYKYGDGNAIELVSAIGATICLRMLFSEQSFAVKASATEVILEREAMRKRMHCRACGALAEHQERAGGLTDIEAIDVIPEGRTLGRPMEDTSRAAQVTQRTANDVRIRNWVDRVEEAAPETGSEALKGDADSYNHTLACPELNQLSRPADLSSPGLLRRTLGRGRRRAKSLETPRHAASTDTRDENDEKGFTHTVR
ncbi:hypothetical protein IE53DRAFT_380134 [Violaceomyces palustris]|uniref:Uncharacterized protein n=1 Tax=Violaceomyces palustris TaxID=1673888 RepID=A0ACD0NVW1_9BASI|nr:hypothetical protein IE53DRAFT_380134 [Violaceomyces palustris]